jgi:hypothetical protein
MKFTKRSQQGFALILVLIIGAAMMIPVLMLLSAAAPRRANVTGGALSDIVLASADGVVDKIATKINTFPSLLNTDPYITQNMGSISGNKDMAYFAIGYLLSHQLNGDGGVTNSSYSDYIAHLVNIEKGVSTYLYDTKTGKYYAVWGTDHIASVGNVGVAGDISLTSTRIVGLSNGTLVSSTGMSGMGDSLWLTDNRWTEIDTNTQFDNGGTNDDAHSRFIIRATAYLLSNNKDMSGRIRTVQAEVSLGRVVALSGGLVPQASGAFTSAVWSAGGLLDLNSTPTINGSVYGGGNVQMSAGGKVTGDLQAGGTLNLNTNPKISGNVYAGGTITVPAGASVGGSIHSGSSIELNTTNLLTVGGDIEATNYIKLLDVPYTLPSNPPQSVTSYGLKSGDHVSMSTGVPYNPPAQSAPNFDFGASSAAASTVAASTTHGTGSILNGSYSYSYWNSATGQADPTTVTVGGSGSLLPYYISGGVSYNTSPTLNFAPISGSTVAWYVGGNVSTNDATLNFTSPCTIYVGGDLSINGSATLNFASPCTIFVGGTFHSNDVVITGHGTIIASQVNFTGSITGAGTDPKVAIILGTSGTTTFSKPVNIPAIIYSPNGSVGLSSGGTVWGSIVAKNGISLASGITLNYDTSMTEGGGAPLIPGPASISFKKSNSSGAFRRSWKELVSSKHTITPSNFTNNNFPAPTVDGDFSQ